MIPPQLSDRNRLAYRAARRSSGAPPRRERSTAAVRPRAVGHQVQRDRGAGHTRRAGTCDVRDRHRPAPRGFGNASTASRTADPRRSPRTHRYSPDHLGFVTGRDRGGLAWPDPGLDAVVQVDLRTSASSFPRKAASRRVSRRLLTSTAAVRPSLGVTRAHARAPATSRCDPGARSCRRPYRVPCNSGAAAVISCTRGALLLSCSEPRRRMPAPDDGGRLRRSSADARLNDEQEPSVGSSEHRRRRERAAPHGTLPAMRATTHVVGKVTYSS
jgi:hypothetical protein